MLASIFATAARYGRLVIGAALMVGVGVVWLWLAGPSSPALRLLPVWGYPLTLVWGLLTVLAVFRGRRRPAFVVDLRSARFRTPPHEAQTFGAVALIMMAVVSVVGTRADAGAPHHVAGTTDIVTVLYAGIWVAAAGLVAVRTMLGLGVQLRPDGLVDRDVLGSLFVPWTALAPGHPGAVPSNVRRLMLAYVRPELVRQRGILVLGRQVLHTNNVDARFLSYAIRYYTDLLDQRSAIGTQAGYERLTAAYAVAARSLSGAS